MRACRARGLDVISSHDVGMDGRTDLEQLRFAASRRRVVVTRDLHDFTRAMPTADASGESYPGVLFVPRSFLDEDPDALALALVAIEALHPQGVPTGFSGYLRHPGATR